MRTKSARRDGRHDGYFVHPLTRRTVHITADSAGEIASYRAHFRNLRRSLKLGLTTVAEVAQVLARLDRDPHRAGGGPPMFRTAAEAYRDSGIAKQTRRRVVTSMEHALRPLMDLSLEQLDPPRLLAWLTALRAKHAPASVAAHWYLVRSIVRLACERNWIPAAPWGQWRPKLDKLDPHERECCRDVEELARLLEAARALDELGRPPPFPDNLEAKIAVGCFLGIRQGEIAGLRWSDVDEAAGTVAIERQYAGAPLKTRKSRAVLRATPALFEILGRWRERARAREWFAPDGPIFPHAGWTRIYERPMPWRQGNIVSLRPLQEAVARAALPSPEKWTAQSLRDSYATLEAAAGDLPRTVQRMRHASIESTLRYMRQRHRGLAEPGFELPPPSSRRQLTLPGAEK